MSLRRILKALDLDITTSEKMILILLSDNANDETGECWPSQKYLADRAGMSRQNVNLIINRLREKGHISFEHRKGEKGQTSNIYKINTVSSQLTPPVKSVDTESVIESLHIANNSIWDVWEQLAGPNSRGILGQLIKANGENEVAKAVGIVLLKRPADPKQYIYGILRNNKPRRKGFQA
jgi:biotin operon repressor|tara:strand:- start:400 stop:936 length:537 start_codon:yes stop_codon:yes gene_type:complete